MLPDAATLWVSDFIEVYEGDTRLPKPRVVATQLVARIGPFFRRLTTGAGARHRAAAVAGHDRGLEPGDAGRALRISDPVRSVRVLDSSRLGRLGLRVVTVLRFLPPGGVVRAFEFVGDPGLVRLDPRWYQAALRFVKLGFLPHPGRDRPSAVPVLPGDPVPALPRADPDRDCVHRGAFDHADRLGLQPRAGRAVVSAADRNADRDVHRLHGAGKYRRRQQRAPPLDDHVRVRPGARIRLLVRVAADACSSPARTCWRRCCRSTSASSWGSLLVLVLMIPLLEVLFRYVVAERMGTIILSALVAHTALALDDRPRVHIEPVPLPMAGIYRRHAGDSAALADGDRGCRRPALAGVRGITTAFGAARGKSEASSRGH